MTLIEQIHQEIKPFHMLQHPFYQDWMSGSLAKEKLQYYAHQYVPFVEAFPRFVSAIHSLCPSLEARKLLLENLLDEEGFRHSQAHPILWKNFSKGLGENNNISLEPAEYAKELENEFFGLCRSSYEEGICALYSYEYQIPEVAESKIVGLAKNYGIASSEAIEFFTVHQKADVYHSDACRQLIEGIPSDKKEVALKAAKKSSELLWNFLTRVHSAEINNIH